MAWTYRKRIKICPGVSINLSKNGISTSFGPRGAKVTVGPKGTYLSAGIPGTGIYSRQKISSSSKPSQQSYTSSLLGSSFPTTSSRSSYNEDYGVSMNMDHDGNVTFKFTDSLDRPITDDATIQRLIRKTKSLPYYKEKLATLTRMTYDEVNAETEAFTDIFKKTPDLKTESEVNFALTKVHQEYYTPLVFSEALPARDKIRSHFEYEAEQKIHHIFWWKNKPERAKYVEENTAKEYDARMREWEEKKRLFDKEQAETKKQKDEEYYLAYKQEKDLLGLFLTDNEESVLDGLKEEGRLIQDEVPGDFGLDLYFDKENRTLFVDVDLPEVEEIPKKKATYLPSGNVSFKQKTQKEIQQDYITCICGLAFFIAGRLFNVNSGIKYAQISGYTQRVNKATGDVDDEYVYSVFFDKDAFSNLIIENIDPLTALREFPCRIKASITGVLTTIKPFPVPGESDYIPGDKHEKEGKKRLSRLPEIAPDNAFVDSPEAQIEHTPRVEDQTPTPLYQAPSGREPLPIEKLERTTYLNNQGILQEKEGKIDDAIATYEENVKLGYPAHHSYKRLMVLYSKRGDKVNELRIVKLALEKFPDELEYKKRLDKLTGNTPENVYPTARVVFEGREVLGDTFENVIRYRVPEFDFYRSATGEQVNNDFLSFKRSLEPVYKLQRHFKSVIEAAEKFEAEGQLDKACYNYEQLLFEKYYIPAPIDRLIKIYSKSNLKTAEKEVLIAAIAHFKALRQSRKEYLDHLAEKYGAQDFWNQRLQEGKKITYFNGVFELYNPFPIVDEWEKRLAKIEI